MQDVENLDAGQDFDQLPDTYTIFITEKDFYGLGKSIYWFERMNLDAEKLFEDGEHILYVNGEYRGTSDIGKLMHDFNCTDANGMNFELMAKRTRYLKENPEGVKQMRKVIEDMRKEEREEGMKESMRATALRMFADGALALEKIAEYLDGPLGPQPGLR